MQSEQSLQEHVGSRIRLARKNLNTSQEQVSAETQINQHNISLYERGKSFPPLEHLITLSKALKVPVSYFFEEFEPPGEDWLELINLIYPKLDAPSQLLILNQALHLMLLETSLSNLSAADILDTIQTSNPYTVNTLQIDMGVEKDKLLILLTKIRQSIIQE